MKHSFASSNTRSSLFSEFIRHHLGIYELVIYKSVFFHILIQWRVIHLHLSTVNMRDYLRYMQYKTDTKRYCRYAKTLNIVFNPIFFVQFFSSIIVLCTSVYYLSRHITESGSATFVVYTIGMFVQIYIYCWSGNEVIIKVKKSFHFTISL